MNLKEKLIKYRDMLIKNNTKKTFLSDAYMDFIKEITETTILTEKQFEFIKNLYLQKGKIIGLHNTYNGNVDSYFNTGLYNYDRMGQKNTDLTNTVMTSSFFTPLVSYHGKDTTIILSFDEEILKGERGVFENLKNGMFGIPPEYIVGALKGKEIIINPKYESNYRNDSAIKLTEVSFSSHNDKEKEEEVRFCSTLFYARKDNEDKKTTKIDKNYN